jgi:hypothetical protein
MNLYHDETRVVATPAQLESALGQLSDQDQVLLEHAADDLAEASRTRSRRTALIGRNAALEVLAALGRLMVTKGYRDD